MRCALTFNRIFWIGLAVQIAFLVVDLSVFQNVQDVFFPDMPASHPAFCVFGKNQPGFVSVKIVVTNLNFNIVAVPRRNPVAVPVNKNSRRQEEEKDN